MIAAFLVASLAGVSFSAANTAGAFQSHCQRHSAVGELRSILHPEEDPTILSPREDDGAARGKTCSLRFTARTAFVSGPLKLPPVGDSALADFFLSSQHRNHLLMGHGATNSADGGKRHGLPAVESLGSPGPDLWARWSAEAERAGTLPPCPSSDELLNVKSSGIQFPLGMTIFADSIVGAKVLLPQKTEGADFASYPEYQFTLVKDTVRAEGPRPLVWVYGMLTGAGKDKEEQTTHSFSTLRVKESEELPGCVVFTSNSSIEINIKFPVVLLRLLPMSKEKCNELGSASIQHAFEDRGAPSLDNFVRAYEVWLTAISGQQ